VIEKDTDLEIIRDDYFSLNSNSDSHPDCLLNPTISLFDSTCLSPTEVSHTIASDKIVFDTSLPYKLTQVCVQVETLGKVISNHMVSIEILGSEKMTLNK
jgi:hypothetical protein